MSKLYYQDDYAKLYLGNGCDMVEVKDCSVDMVLMDPPWMVSGEVTIHRSMNTKKHYKYKGKDISMNFGEWDWFDNDDEYWIFTYTWLVEATRCLKDKGHLVVFFDQNKVTKLIEYTKQLGFVMRQHIYWLKTNPVPRARKVDFMIALEQACWFTKGTKSGATFNYQLGQQRNYVEAPIPGHTTKLDGCRIHPTQKPVKVLMTWIKYLTNAGDTVLDPMCGSASTLLAAKLLGRKSIGYEINKEYIKSAADRLRQQVMEVIECK
jgi:site-specific DNA-methyltransferase (adenine-specific)